jgi:hypothetical protein
MLVARESLRIDGNLDQGTYSQNGRGVSSTYGCVSCKVQIFTESTKRPGFASLRSGTLDRSSEVVPAAHFWIRSKQTWVSLPKEAPAHAEQPATTAEWLGFVGRA